MKPSGTAQVMGGADATLAALPIDVLSEAIQPEVVTALARWRDVDQYSLHDLAGVLVTKGGAPIIDNPGYLSALHGFVAEQFVSEHFASALPDSTTVPAIDIFINGVPYQVKEGTTAFEQAQNALQRYPGVTHFVSDPETAARLQSEGVDAIGLDQLSPEHVATTTTESILGVSALEHAGALHIPILTTVFSICRYWEAYDSEQLDAATAIGRGVTDVGAQALGAAIGLKAAAIAVVAAGAFAVSAVPLTVGAIVGALGLRGAIQHARAKALREALRELEQSTDVAESAANIVIERSREDTSRLLTAAADDLRAVVNRCDEAWIHDLRHGLQDVVAALQRVGRALLASYRPLAEDGDYRAESLEFVRASSAADPLERTRALSSCVASLVAKVRCSGADVEEAIGEAEAAICNRFAALAASQDVLRSEAEGLVDGIRRQATIDLLAQYAILVERLARLAQPVTESLRRVGSEREKLFAARLPL